MQTQKPRKLKWFNIAGYGAADIFGNGALTVASTWMLFFYTSVGGLSPIAAGSILGIARVCDSFISPLMGYLTDHFGNTWLGRKFGRRRFFLLAAVPLMFIYVIIWIAHMNYLFYLVTYLLMEAFTAMVMIPYETLASEMTMDYDERTKMTSSRMLWAAIATFLASWLPGRFFAIFGKSSPKAFLANGIALSLIFIVTLLITYFTTWERPNNAETDNVQEKKAKSQSNGGALTGLWHALKDMGSVFRIKSYALHLIIYLFTFTARDIIGATYVYFVVYAIQSNSIQASNLLTFGSIIGIPCNLLWPKIMSKLGPSRMLRVMYIIMFGTTAAYGFLYLSPLVGTAQILIFMYVLQITWGISNSGTGYVPWTVYTFMPDVDEIVTKERREGVFAGIMTFARKTTSALAPFLTGIVLEGSGFVENASHQSAHALDGLVLWMVIGVGVLLLVATVATFFFKLDKQHHEILVNEVNRLKNGGSMADVEPETKKVVENLTGFKYEKLWGHNNLL
ncbi:MFS transporter [Lactiplantibacillus modestisalitolerans]|uniref:MFS transporter n=1 Tax=Lactiplantibacillus modestisalitolerans TaxID=1457219 RepID=A0ABV5WST6_9LACO|nr:MFS transporter [Lactiplantibacillus modestisalitolerans]